MNHRKMKDACALQVGLGGQVQGRFHFCFLLAGARTLLVAPGLTTRSILTTRSKDASSNKCLTSSNKCLTSSNKCHATRSKDASQLQAVQLRCSLPLGHGSGCSSATVA